MTTELGPARIRVELDVKHLNEQITQARKQAETIGKITAQTNRITKDTAQVGTSSLGKLERKINQMERRSAVRQVTEARVTGRGRGRRPRRGVQLPSAGALLAAPAAVLLSMIPGIGPPLAKALEKVAPFGELGIATLAGAARRSTFPGSGSAAAVLEDLSDEVSKLQAFFASFQPTFEQFKQMTTALVLLNQPVSGSQAMDLLTTFQSVHELQGRAERQKRKIVFEKFGGMLMQHLTFGP